MTDNFTEAPYSVNVTFVHKDTQAWYQFTIRASNWATLWERVREQKDHLLKAGFVSREAYEANGHSQPALPPALPATSESGDEPTGPDICTLVEDGMPVAYEGNWSWKVKTDKSKYPIYISNVLFDQNEWLVNGKRATPNGPFEQGAALPLRGKKARFETKDGGQYPYRIVEIF